MKIDRHGQAAIITTKLYPKIRAGFYEAHHQLLFDLAVYTGERWGAICQLQVADVYQPNGKPRTTIIYRKDTTKGKITREVPVCQSLALRLAAYKPPSGIWLFPNSKDPTKHLTIRALDGAFRRALERAGLSDLGYSTHSTRRGFITALDRAGISIKVIQSLTGHRSIACLSRYIDVSDEQRAKALEAI
jgi:integrase/recombinase XerD